ncbi:MAG: site-specific integrase [Phycisphaerae bacterium]|jgi:integrase
MPTTKRRKARKPPAYRQRKGYTQAIVTLRDSATKRARDYWLGECGTPASRELYHRVIAAWEANDRRLPDPAEFDDRKNGAVNGPTVGAVIRAYWRWAKGYYHIKHSAAIKSALKLLRQHHGQTPAADFGPKKLRLLREAMITGFSGDQGSRRPWSRKYINAQVQRVRHMFKWASAREMVPVTVYQSLGALEPLRRGRTKARENQRVGPVPDELLGAVRPYLNRQVRALVELQLLTGARPAELLGLRPVDIDLDAGPGVWAHRPAEHKNAFREKERVIYLGPQAQKVLRPFLAARPLNAYLFSPAEADAERRSALHAERATPLPWGNRPGTNRRTAPKRKPGDRYTPTSYYRSIQYACEKAFPSPERLGKRSDETRAAWRARLTAEEQGELKAWRQAHSFHPYQLRHNAATNLRREFGLEAAQLALGHASAQITDAVYAERDRAKVIEIMRKIG